MKKMIFVLHLVNIIFVFFARFGRFDSTKQGCEPRAKDKISGARRLFDLPGVCAWPAAVGAHPSRAGGERCARDAGAYLLCIPEYGGFAVSEIDACADRKA